MDIQYLNRYQRLRDFNVPASILDEIFGNEEDLVLLIEAWDALKKEGYKGDEIAREIAELIFKELSITQDQDLFE